VSALATLLGDFHAAILDNAPGACAAAIRPHPRLSAAQQMAIYTQGYRLRLSEVIGNEYPATRHLLGDDAFSALAAAFIEATAEAAAKAAEAAKAADAAKAGAKPAKGS